MKILVTGGAGFIGSHVADALIAKGHAVIVVDNLSTGRKENIPGAASFIEADITDYPRIEEIFETERPEIVFHLAAQIDVRRSVADPLADANINILASLNLIEFSRAYNIKKFIFSSTGGAIYGEAETRPTPETYSEWPLSPYGIAKLSVDKYLHYCHEVHGFPYVSLRYGNVYGPRQNPHGEAGVVAIFMNKMLAGVQPVINGDGTQTRDYVFVADVVNANIKALEDTTTGEIYNVGTSVETSVNKLFDEINSHFENGFDKAYGPAKQGEQQTSCLDYAKIYRDLSWKPAVDVTGGIRQTYEWFRDNHRKA